MSTRRDFLKYAGYASAGATLLQSLPDALARALAIDPAEGSTFRDAEHVVILMQENRSFDHAYGTLRGVRGFNDPRAIRLPNDAPVWMQTNARGESFLPFRLDLKNTKATWMSSLPHAWADQVDARNNGKYDKWLEAKAPGKKEYAQMPLTMGYYNREDIPFYYDLADSFTICDQHFCSSLTGTTPNRLYLWTGTIHDSSAASSSEELPKAAVWNEDADLSTMVNWKTFPERLEDWGISWKVYQNEIYADTGFEGEEESWLSNFGDNPLEYFSQFNVKLSPRYIRQLPIAEKRLLEEIAAAELVLKNATISEREQASIRLSELNERLSTNRKEQRIYTREAFDRLSDSSKQLHHKAFTRNEDDKDFRKLEDYSYDNGGTKMTMKVPPLS